MKLFLALLLVASCQAIELFDTASYEVTKEVQLKDLVKVAEGELFDEFVKKYPNEDPAELRKLAHHIAVLVKTEIDNALTLIDQGSKLAQKLTENMWENLKKAASDMVDSVDTVPESLKKFLHDLTRDIEEMENLGVFEISLEELFDELPQRVAFKVEYGAVERFDIWGDLNDTLHRIVGHLSGKFGDLKDFFHKTIKIGSEKLQPHLINIKKLAADLLNNVSVVSKNVAAQALEFFRPFHKQLGDLWVKLVEKVHARFHDLANTDTY